MKKKRFWNVVFCLYGALMLWLLFDRVGYDPARSYFEQMRYNLIPLKTIRLYWDLLGSTDSGLRLHAIVNLLGNVIMFVPLGYLLPRVSPRQRKFCRAMLTTAGIILAVEVSQLLTLLGSCDADDLLLNVLGAAIGYCVYRLTAKK